MIKNKRAVRAKLRKKQNKLCFYCGCTLKRNAHIDHVIPQRSHGSDKIFNLCLTCPRCNTYKSGSSLRRWLEKLEARNKQGRYANWKRWDNLQRRNVIRKLFSLVEEEVAVKKEMLVEKKVVSPRQIEPAQTSTVSKMMDGLSTVLDSAEQTCWGERVRASQRKTKKNRSSSESSTIYYCSKY